MQGPVGDAFLSKFLIVYGEGDKELALAEIDALRNPVGPLIIAGDFPLKAASKVTPEDVQSSNLILFGTPETNSVIKRIAASLPSPSTRNTRARGVNTLITWSFQKKAFERASKARQ